MYLLVPGSALAHAYLDHADPPPSSTVAQAPTQLRLTFSEQVDSAFSQVHVLNGRRETVDRGDGAVASDDPRAMVVSLQPGLADGASTPSPGERSRRTTATPRVAHIRWSLARRQEQWV